jgi:DNA-binding XRE family transcriptional regulator
MAASPARRFLYLALRIAAYFEVPVEVIFATEPFQRLGA